MLRKKNHSLIVAIQRVRTLVSAMTLSISEGDPRPFRIQVARHASVRKVGLTYRPRPSVMSRHSREVS